MASETIGDWAVRLTANSSGLISGLEASAAKIKSFATTAVTATKTMATGVNTALAAVTRVDLGAQTAQLQGLASSVIGIGSAIATGGTAAIVGAITAAAVTLVSFASASMDAVDVQVRLGRQIGVTAQQAAGLQILADRMGVSGDTLSQGLTIWGRQLGVLRNELRNGVDGPLTQGLRDLGIDARTFAAAGVAEQFALIAEGAQRIEDPMMRTAMLTNVMSRRAAEMLPLFRAQGDEIRNVNRIAGQYGFSITQGQAEMISSVVKQLKELGRYVGSFLSMYGQQIAVLWAPAASAAGTMLRSLVTEARPVLGLLSGYALSAMALIAGAVYGVVAAVNFFMPSIVAFGDMISLVMKVASATFAELQPIAVAVLTAIGEALPSTSFLDFSLMLQAMVPVVGFFARSVANVIVVMVTVVTAQLALMARAIGATASVMAAVSFGTVGTGTASSANAFRIQMERAAAASLVALGAINSSTNQTVTSGASNPVAAIAVTGLRSSQDELEAFAARMRSVLEYRNPFETWRDSVVELREVLAGIDNMDLNRSQGFGALGRSVESVLQNAGQQQSRSPAAVLAGSVAEQRAIVQSRLQERDASRDPIERLIAFQQQQAERQRRQVELGELTLRAIEDGRLTTFGD